MPISGIGFAVIFPFSTTASRNFRTGNRAGEQINKE
jgi:hypothetical protein